MSAIVGLNAERNSSLPLVLKKKDGRIEEITVYPTFQT